METRYRIAEGHTHHTEKGDQLFGVVSSFCQSPGLTDIGADQSQDHVGKREYAWVLQPLQSFRLPELLPSASSQQFPQEQGKP